MTAYNKTDLFNKYMQEQASEAFRNTDITAATYQHILEKHPHGLYTPHYFIRAGLGLLTIVAVTLSLTFVWLITGASSNEGIVILLAFFSLACYAFLEIMVKHKKYYNAGIDNVLMCAVLLLIASCFFVYDVSKNSIPVSCTVMIVSAWMAVRFADAFMGAIAYLAGLALCFLWYTKLGSFGTLTVPFILMLLSVIAHLYMQKLAQQFTLVIYRYCFQWLVLLSLLSFYASGNYYVINEMSIAMFGASAKMEWFFWIFTLVVPLGYIFYGIRQKQPLYYRTGVVLLVVAVLTVRYYHAVMPAEIAMLVFGMFITIACYTLIKYLSAPRKGYTFENTGHTDKGLLNTEALIIAQVFGRKAAGAQAPVEFGGGSSGGGGAAGNY